MCSDISVEENEIKENMLPKGKYSLISFTINCTGRRIMDEIIQLAAYTTKDQFSQYVLPHGNIRVGSKQRHKIAIINQRYSRRLKCLQTSKLLKARTEYSTLKSFLDWLDNVKKSETESLGIILMYHEQRNVMPYQMLEALNRYNLLERFTTLVKGFVNTYMMAGTKLVCCTEKFTLQQLSRSVLNKDLDRKNIEEFLGCANVRAKYVYLIFESLAITQEPSYQCENSADQILQMLAKYIVPIQVELVELDLKRKLFDLENTFHPFFVAYYDANSYCRNMAINFRIALAAHNYNLQALEKIWHEKQEDGIEEVVGSLSELKNELKDDLFDIIVFYFDSNGKPLKPDLKQPRKKKRTSTGNNKNETQQKNNWESNIETIPSANIGNSGILVPPQENVPSNMIIHIPVPVMPSVGNVIMLPVFPNGHQPDPLMHNPNF